MLFSWTHRGRRTPARPGDGSAALLRTSVLWTSSRHGIAVLRVSGEVDLYTLPRLRRALADALDLRPAYLIVELTGLEFCSCGGFATLADAALAAAIDGPAVAVSGLPPRFDRVSRIVWQDGLPVRFATTAHALEWVRADTGHRHVVGRRCHRARS